MILITIRFEIRDDNALYNTRNRHLYKPIKSFQKSDLLRLASHFYHLCNFNYKLIEATENKKYKSSTHLFHTSI
jgi:hypothetical protein